MAEGHGGENLPKSQAIKDATMAYFIHKNMKENTKFLLGNRCFYVGQSAKKPSLRFLQHKDGYKSNTYAKRFGMKLVPEFYEKYNPIPTRKDAEDLEEYVSYKLRKERYGVWFN